MYGAVQKILKICRNNMNKNALIVLVLLIPHFCFSAQEKDLIKQNAFNRYVENIVPLSCIGIKAAVGVVCLGFGASSLQDLLAAHRKNIQTPAHGYVINGFLVASGMYNIVQAIKDYRNL